ncbi:MAG: flagellar basal body P-ring formation chaperone FlgA [Paracoccaceae bacterium]
MRRWIAIVLILPSWVSAEITVPGRTIRAKEIIRFEDLIQANDSISGVLSRRDQAVGLEAKTTLYAGRPIKFEDVGPPAVVGRNDLVTLVFVKGPLRISTEGRALGRGALGEVVRVMNLSSRTVLNGRIRSDGVIEIE